MGGVFSLEEIARGEIPPVNGAHHLLAARAIFVTIKRYNNSKGNFFVAAQGYGSTYTGQAGPRSDLDIFLAYARKREGELVRSNGNEESVEEALFLESLKQMVAKKAIAYHVKAEAQVIQLCDAREGVARLRTDPPDVLYLDHIVKAPKAWRIGDPLQKMAELAVDITKPLDANQANNVASTAINYADYREGYFEKWLAGGPEELQLIALARALESAKAMARKTVAMDVVAGSEAPKADETSRASMYEQFRLIATDAHNSADLLMPFENIVALDRGYDELVELARRGILRTNGYKEKLRKCYPVALESARDLSKATKEHFEAIVDGKSLRPT